MKLPLTLNIGRHHYVSLTTQRISPGIAITCQRVSGLLRRDREDETSTETYKHAFALRFQLIYYVLTFAINI